MPINTGRKIYTTLYEVYTDTMEPTGRTKANIPTDPDYVPPVLDLTLCPLPGNIPDGIVTNQNEIIFIVNESTKLIEWNAVRKDRFGDFPVIDVWLLQLDNTYAIVNQPIQSDNPPPNTTQIYMDFGEVVNGFIIIS